jgi:hypothetical protein
MATHASLGPPTSSRDGLVAGACAAVAVATVLIAALVPGAHREARPMAVFERDATCLEWTDACVVCTRTPQGHACSTPGIACEPAPPRCLRRTGS